MQALKVPGSILVTEEGMFRELNPEQPLKAQDPTVVTEEGITRVSNPEQQVKAPSPIVTSEEGSEMDFMLSHHPKLKYPIE